MLAASTRISIVIAWMKKNAMSPSAPLPTMARAIWLITVSLVLGSGCSFQARKEMPRNITPSSTPSQASTRRAFFHSTGLNAGTPLEIASTPVIAVEPPANACSSRKMPSEPPAPAATSAWWTWMGSRPPMTALATPTITRAMMAMTKPYVGTAKTRPDSFTPRRFIQAMIQISTTAMATRYGYAPGNAEYIAATPAETLTATVRM